MEGSFSTLTPSIFCSPKAHDTDVSAPQSRIVHTLHIKNPTSSPVAGALSLRIPCFIGFPFFCACGRKTPRSRATHLKYELLAIKDVTYLNNREKGQYDFTTIGNARASGVYSSDRSTTRSVYSTPLARQVLINREDCGMVVCVLVFILSCVVLFFTSTATTVAAPLVCIAQISPYANIKQRTHTIFWVGVCK